MTQTIADTWREEGRAEGQAEGRLLAYRDALKRLLTLRFHSLPDEIAQRIDQVTDIERLKTAFEQAMLLNNPEELGL